ncbi:MAG TPA: class I SAM-dependent methyltransferase [Verrucomicrobiae bacterium]|jgi:demethylmenaquinone methyltransferase/2-methoxy-6-polyprenyl-1,4-benzoquinol methylase|nr:class I SAM-dependent methyltransferase [Verrucomicrobiae bacterium]
MTNKFYQPGAQRAEKVNDLFAAVAPRYDLINDWQSLGWHRWWKRALIAAAAVQPGDRALDVCCGTGDLAVRLERAGAEVTGLDFSAAMLAIARPRSSGIQWIEGDALRLPFADQTFDVVTVGYGLRNLANWEVGLAEMWRVARPGGRLLVLDFGKPDQALWRAIYFGYLRRVVPLFGRVFCHDAATHAYILESLRHYPAQRGVAAKLTALGGGDVKTRNFLGGAMSLSVARKP